MRLERVNDRQVRVRVSNRDLKTRGLSLAELAENSDKGKELFAEIMCKVKERYNFPIDEDDPIVIEAAPVSEKELVVMVSSVAAGAFNPAALLASMLPMALGGRGLTREKNDFFEQLAKELVLEEPDQRKKATGKRKPSVLVYLFESFEDACAAAARACGLYDGTNALYKLDGLYYLCAREDNRTSVENREKFKRVMLDYGESYAEGELAATVISERGELISKSAVQKLAALA